MAYVIGNDCIACGTCIDECPVGAISEGDIYKIDADACTECGTCASVCPNEAISLPYGFLILLLIKFIRRVERLAFSCSLKDWCSKMGSRYLVAQVKGDVENVIRCYVPMRDTGS